MTTLAAIRSGARRLTGAPGDYDELLELIGDARFVLHRRGVARDARVLPGARRDHEAADRGEGVHRRRGRGRLAGRLPGQPLRPGRRRGRRRRATRSPASSASRPGCGATPTCSTSSAGCAPTTSSAGRADRLLRSRPLQPLPLDRGGDRLPRQGRSRGAADGARDRYACFERFEESQAYGYAVARWRLRAVRAGGRRASSSSCSGSAADYLRRDGLAAEDELFYAEQNARLVLNAERVLPHDVRRRGASSWNLRDRHMAETLDGLVAHLDRHAGEPRGGRLGAQLAPRRRAAHRDGSPAASSTSASSCASGTAATPSWSASPPTPAR